MSKTTKPKMTKEEFLVWLATQREALKAKRAARKPRKTVTLDEALKRWGM